MKEEIKKARTEIDDALELVNTKKTIRDNVIEFDYNGEKYRVVLPTLEKEQELENAKAKKLNQILSETYDDGKPIYLFKKQWKEIYAKRGLDLGEKEAKISILNIDFENLLENLAETKDKPRIEEIEKELNKKKDEMAELVAYLVDKYQYCVEYILLFFSKNYLLSLVLEKLDKETKQETKNINTWKKVYSSFDEMQKEKDTKLLRTGLSKLSDLVDFRIDEE